MRQPEGKPADGTFLIVLLSQQRHARVPEAADGRREGGKRELLDAVEASRSHHRGTKGSTCT
eukprot:11864310-Heterocapsa_arctica.AAC.1